MCACFRLRYICHNKHQVQNVQNWFTHVIHVATPGHVAGEPHRLGRALPVVIIGIALATKLKCCRIKGASTVSWINPFWVVWFVSIHGAVMYVNRAYMRKGHTSLSIGITIEMI